MRCRGRWWRWRCRPSALHCRASWRGAGCRRLPGSWARWWDCRGCACQGGARSRGRRGRTRRPRCSRCRDRRCGPCRRPRGPALARWVGRTGSPLMSGPRPRRRGSNSRYAWCYSLRLASSARLLLFGLESRCRLDLVEPVEAHLLDHAVAHHDQPCLFGREMLVVGERRDIDEVAAFPLELLGHLRPFPFERVEAVELQIPVQVVAGAFGHEDDFLPHVAMPARAFARLEEFLRGRDVVGVEIAGVRSGMRRPLVAL